MRSAALSRQIAAAITVAAVALAAPLAAASAQGAAARVATASPAGRAPAAAPAVTDVQRFERLLGRGPLLVFAFHPL